MTATGTHAGEEQLILVIHEHWIRYVRLVFVYALLTLCSAVLFFVAGFTAYATDWFAQPVLLAAIGLFLVTHHWFFMAVLSQAENHIIVTSRRVIWIRHRLFFDEEMHEYSFDKMKTVESDKKNILQYLLEYGTLRFESGAKILYVPHPNAVVRTIEQAMNMV